MQTARYGLAVAYCAWSVGSAKVPMEKGACMRRSIVGVALGALLTIVLIVAAGPWMQAQFGIGLKLSAPSATEWMLLGAVLLAGLLASGVPGLRAYRLSLADGLSPRT